MALSISALNRCFSFLRVAPFHTYHLATFSMGNISYDAASKSATTTKKAKPARKPSRNVNVAVKIVERKRAPSSYNLYLADTIARVKKEHPDMSQADIFKQAATSFHGLDQKEKEKYTLSAAKLRQDFLEKKQASMKPKRPQTAYNFYVKEASATRPKDVPMTEYIKTLAEKFKNLSEAEKAVFVSLASKDKKRHAKDVAARPPAKATLKRSPSAYNMFVKDFQGKAASGQELLKMAALEWKKVDDSTKQRYLDLAAKEKIRFDHDHGKPGAGMV